MYPSRSNCEWELPGVEMGLLSPSATLGGFAEMKRQP